MKNEFCIQCREVVTPQIVTNTETHNYRGEAFKFEAKSAVCPKCGESFLITEAHNDNMHTLQAMYRKQHDLLTPAEIISIREQYGLATKSFAKILGLGEISITRYENGHVQEEAQNNLILLMKSKAAFTQLYEKNKHRLTDKEVEKVDGILSKCQLLVSWGGKQYSPKNAAKAQYPAIQCADSQSVKCLVTQSA